MTDVEKLLRRAQRGPEHAAESRRLRAPSGVVKREHVDPGFTDERVPGTLLEFSIAAGASMAIVPMHIDPREWSAEIARQNRVLWATPTAYRDGGGRIQRVVFWIVGLFPWGR